MSQLQVGIIGTGVISELHWRAYQQITEAKVTALCDLNEATVQSKAKKWSVQKIYTDFNALLADPEIQTVEILTPQQFHKEITVAALKAGKHVSVQKPMAVTLAEANEMLVASKGISKVAWGTDEEKFSAETRNISRNVSCGG